MNGIVVRYFTGSMDRNRAMYVVIFNDRYEKLSILEMTYGSCLIADELPKLCRPINCLAAVAFAASINRVAELQTCLTALNAVRDPLEEC